MTYIAVFAVAAAAAAVIAPAAQALARRLHLVAKPGGRRQHERPTAVLGGVPLFGGYLAGVALVYLLLPPNTRDAPLLGGVLGGSAVVFVGGLVDDRFDLPFWAQYLVQLLGVAVAFSVQLFFARFTNPLTGAVIDLHPDYPLATFVITAIWITAMMNAVNWLDGTDGLASGVGAVAAFMFAAHAYQLGQSTVAAFPIALAGALIGFLPFNFAPARIFLGTAGVWVLGYNLATLAILSPAKIATALLVLALPLLDFSWRIIDRVRRGQSPFRGDRGHLHFVLLDRGWSPQRIALSYYAVALLFGAVALFAPSAELKLGALVLLTAIFLLLIVRLTARE